MQREEKRVGGENTGGHRAPCGLSSALQPVSASLLFALSVTLQIPGLTGSRAVCLLKVNIISFGI